MTDPSTTNGADHIDPPTVAVTGAAGYIGSRVLVEFQATHPEWDLIALDNQYSGQVSSVGDVDIEHVDVRNRERLEASLAGADVVCHLAAISGVEDCGGNPELAYDINVTGTNNVAWFCRKTGAGLAFPFSMAVLGDPESFPITADQPRDPLNWYGRTKWLGERSIEAFADGAFPAHLFMKSNLYGEHVVDGTVVSKPTVVNRFVTWALEEKPLTVYKPGTQARNFVHVTDVARVYVRSVERLLNQLECGVTGHETYEVASDDVSSIIQIAETIRDVIEDVHDFEVDIELIENPRAGETVVERFDVDTSNVREQLDWTARTDITSAIEALVDR